MPAVLALTGCFGGALGKSQKHEDGIEGPLGAKLPCTILRQKIKLSVKSNYYAKTQKDCNAILLLHHAEPTELKHKQLNLI